MGRSCLPRSPRLLSTGFHFKPSMNARWLSPKLAKPICPPSFYQEGPPALSQGNPVLGKVSGPTAWDPPSAFDPSQPLKSLWPQLPAVSSAPGQPWLPQRASVPGDPGGDKGNKWNKADSSGPSPRRPRGRGLCEPLFPAESRVGPKGGSSRVEFCK